MHFHIDKAITPLEWNWRPYVDLSGTVPEPSDRELRKFNRALRNASIDVVGRDFDATNPDEVAQVFRDLTDEQLEKMEEANLAAIAAITKGSPSLKQLQDAPIRLRKAFTSWLIQELNAPGQAA